VLPNALAPTIQVFAINLAWLVGGIVVVEAVFQFPGVGLALRDAVTTRDLPVIQAITLIVAVFYVGLNLVSDLATTLLTPKLRTRS
jgi:peptide/nickel transport system permease protein